MNDNWSKWIGIVGFRCALALPLASLATAQQSLESAYRTTGSGVVEAFEEVRAVLQTSSAVIQDGRDESGYGVVISADGHILAKASEFVGLKHPMITVDAVSYREVKPLAIDLEWDVVLLKINAIGLIPVSYAPTSDVAQGTWVVANGVTTRTKRRALAGIISAKIREIPAAGGAALGVVLKPDVKVLEIEAVNEKSGANEAGLKKGDVIVAVDGKKVTKIEQLAAALKDRKAGSTVKIDLRRGKESLTMDVRLSAKSEMFTDQMNRNDMMSGDFSKRRSGFPRVMQHDILGSSKVTGGPLLDLSGRCLGMNIARANRAESFAIPLEDLQLIAARLMKQANETATLTEPEPKQEPASRPQ